MEELISIIVPVYNVELYIKKCVDKIIAQSYKNLEIILVDDGSTDLSGKICDEYALKDSRIKVIHKKNGGLSDARNAALDIMSGLYVTCIDSDDYVDKRYVEYLYNILTETKSDISVCATKIVNEKDEVVVKRQYTGKVSTYNQHDALFEILSCKNFSNSAWGKLYRADLFNGIRYPYGRIFEDLPTTYKLFFRADRVVYGSEPYYNYLLRSGSLSRQTKFNMSRMDAVLFTEEMVTAIVAKYYDLRNIGRCRLFDAYISVFRFVEKKSLPALYYAIWKKIKSTRFCVLRYSSSGRNRKIYALMTFSGSFIFRKFVSIIKNK